MDIGVVAPAWVQQAVWLGLLISSIFYVARMCIPNIIWRAYAKYDPATGKQIEPGYYDWDNEFGHFLCIYATCQAFGPITLQLQPKFWMITLSLGAVFFSIRGLTWGPKRPRNAWWWDWPHVGMFTSMALMYSPINLGTWSWILQLLFWLIMVAYYAYLVYECYTELKDPTFSLRYHFLSIGATLSHLMMGIPMFIMVAFPFMLMPLYNTMPGMICYVR